MSEPIRCISCGSERPAGEMIPARRTDFAVIPDRFVCRDFDACYDAVVRVPITELEARRNA